jgi:hypothetical protein
MSKLVSSIALAAGFLISASGANAADLVLNGDFQQGPVGAKPAHFTVFPGKEITVGSEAAYGGIGAAVRDPSNLFAAFGGGNVDNISVLSQVLDTVAGQAYSLSFDFGTYGELTSSQTLMVGLFDSGTNTELLTLSFADAGSTNFNNLFQNYSTQFIALGNATRLSFSISGQTSANVDALVDNVSVAAVPEPATWAMFLMGFGAVGYSMRSRKVSYKALQSA